MKKNRNNYYVIIEEHVLHPISGFSMAIPIKQMHLARRFKEDIQFARLYGGRTRIRVWFEDSINMFGYIRFVC